MEKIIFLIDDSPSDRRVFRRFLETDSPFPLKIYECGSGQAAIETCQRVCPDCIVLDFKLPDLDGLKLIPGLRKLCDAPIIFVTGQPMPLTQTQAYRYGVVKYISKDFISSESLKAAVKDAVEAGPIAGRSQG